MLEGAFVWEFKTTCLYYQREKYCTIVEMNKKGIENEDQAIVSKDDLGSRIKKNWLN